MTSDTYLIWSHEHSAWWGPDQCGYEQRLAKAGRYTRAEALAICARSMPGDSTRMRALPELPVRLEDVDIMVERYVGAVGDRDEPWR